MAGDVRLDGGLNSWACAMTGAHAVSPRSTITNHHRAEGAPGPRQAAGGGAPGASASSRSVRGHDLVDPVIGAAGRGVVRDQHVELAVLVLREGQHVGD